MMAGSDCIHAFLIAATIDHVFDDHSMIPAFARRRNSLLLTSVPVRALF
jgi:hypothetical protein